MTSDIILEHIDVIVIGPKKYQFMELILQKQLFVKRKANSFLSSSIKQNNKKNTSKSSTHQKSSQHYNNQKNKNQLNQTQLKSKSLGYLQILASFLPSSKKYLKSESQKIKGHSLLQEEKIKQEQKNIKVSENLQENQLKQSQRSNKQLIHHGKQKKKHQHIHHQSLPTEYLDKPTSVQLLSSHSTIPHSVSNRFCGIKKFCKIIQTSSFWITINFFIFDMKIYDPILSQYCKGNISICIMVDQDQHELLLSEENQQQAQQEENLNQKNLGKAQNNSNNSSNDLNQIKNYMSGNNNGNNSGNFNYYNYNSMIHLTEHGKQGTTRVIKNESFLQSKILSRFHSPTIAGFNSLLKIKLTPQNRLIQESNNLRLSNNQVFRWIVDCYFENKYHIKLKQSLGDEIEKGEVSFLAQNNGGKSTGYECQIM